MILNKLNFVNVKTNQILVCDSHTLTREGIISVLSRKARPARISQATNFNELKNEMQSMQFDLVIIDFHLPGHFRIENIDYLKAEFPQVSVLVISTNQTRQDILRVLDAGISGYLLKECDADEIVEAVHAILDGEKFFCGRVMDSLLEKENHKCTPGSACDHCMPISLSNREVEIVKLIAEGLTTKDIARKIHLSFFTVATHRKNIFRKLQIRNSPELIHYALREGIISSPGSL